MWDDNSNYAKFYQRSLNKLQDGPAAIVHTVTPADRHMDRDTERRIVAMLIKDAGLSEGLIGNINHTRIALSAHSTEALVRLCDVPPDWVSKAHHLTIAVGPSDGFIEGAKVLLPVTGIGRSEKVIAVKVEYEGASHHKTPHIVVGHPKGGKSSHACHLQYTAIHGLVLEGLTEVTKDKCSHQKLHPPTKTVHAPTR